MHFYNNVWRFNDEVGVFSVVMNSMFELITGPYFALKLRDKATYYAQIFLKSLKT